MTPEEELLRLPQVGAENELAGSKGLLRYVVQAAEPSVVVGRSTDVLRVVLERSRAWPPPAEWRRLLPVWFVDACAPDASEQQGAWTLDAWLYWLEPEQRSWFWWGAELTDSGVEVLVEVDSWPYPDGALRWLLVAAGASRVESP
jgi:hypothetical protein